MDGFEILNASPKALDFPPAAREEALALCRRRDLPVFAVTDNHGWGSSPPGWNLMRIPGWRGMDRAGLEKEVVRTVRKGGFGAVSVAARPRVEASGGLALALDPPRQAVLALRVLTSRQVLVLLAWLWGCVLLRRPRR